jgi:hypothetical protein
LVLFLFSLLFSTAGTSFLSVNSYASYICVFDVSFLKVSWPLDLLFPSLLPSAFSSVGPLQSESVVLINTPVLSATKQQGVHLLNILLSLLATPSSIWWPFSPGSVVVEASGSGSSVLPAAASSIDIHSLCQASTRGGWSLHFFLPTLQLSIPSLVSHSIAFAIIGPLSWTHLARFVHIARHHPLFDQELTSLFHQSLTSSAATAFRCA